MMRLAILPVLVGAVLGAAPVAAEAQLPPACTETANVAWETDWDTVTVEAAIVHVPGCADGDEVGVQVLTDDGAVPDEPLVGHVQDEHVRFDLAALDLRVEPVTGVRVLLYGEAIVEIVHVTVEQRFFGQTGNEQRGLRRTTVLEVPLGGTYRVPGAPRRYALTACEGTRRWAPPSDLLAEGAGTFPATAAGTHVVCYRQQPGTPGGPPDVEAPEVDETDVLGSGVEGGGGAPDAPGGTSGPLASTGVHVVMLSLAGVLLVVLGRVLTRLRQRREPGGI